MKLIVISQKVCSACRVLENYLKNEHPELEYEHINISENPDAIEKYGVTGTPTTILWDDEDGEELTRHIGFDFDGGDDIIEDFIIQLD